MPTEKQTMLNMQLSQKLKSRLEKKAKENGVTLSGYCRMLLLLALKKAG